MRDALQVVHDAINVLSGHGRRGRSTKAEKAKAVSSIADCIGTRATSSALSENSVLEICAGLPTPEILDAGFLSWNGLAVEVLTAMAEMCNNAITSSTKTTMVRPEFMTCLRVLIKSALSGGPPGVLRSVVPAFFTFMFQWLSERVLRDKLADDIWQTVRDMLQHEDNRAMLSPGIIKTWVNVCFEQIIARGPYYQSSRISTNFAHESFVLLAKPCRTFDVLTQGRKGMHSDNMQGLDFGYVFLMERCCLMLALAKSMKERQEHYVQSTALQCLTALLERYCLDLTGSSAAKLVLSYALPATVALWTDRRYHETAVDAGKILIRLAQCNNLRSALHPIRERIELDFGNENGASSVARSHDDIKQNKVEVAGKIFSSFDILTKISTRGVSAVCLSAWLRTLTYVLVHGDLSVNEKNADSDLPSAFITCTRVAKYISELITNKNGEEARSIPIEVLMDCCKAMQACAEFEVGLLCKLDGPQRRARQSYVEHRRAWSSVYSCFLQQLMQIKYATSFRTKRSVTSSATAAAAERPLMDCLVAILSSGLVDKSVLYSSSSNGMIAMQQSATWQTLFADGGSVLSSQAISFVRAHISLAGVRDADNPNFRLTLARKLFSFCDPQESNQSDVEALENCIASILGLSRGVCTIPIPNNNDRNSYSSGQQDITDGIDAFISHFCAADIQSDISSRRFVRNALASANSSNVNVSRRLFMWPQIWDASELSSNPSWDLILFNVGKPYRDLIEHEFVQHVLCYLDNLFLDEVQHAESDSMWLTDSAQSDGSSFASKVMARYQALSNSGIHKPISVNHASVVQVAFLVSHFMEQGLLLGSMSFDELASNSTSSVSHLQFILTNLLMKIAATPGVEIVKSPEILSSLITSSSRIYWRSRLSNTKSTRDDMNSGESDINESEGYSSSLAIDLLSRIVDNYALCVCNLIEDKTVKVIEKIKQVIFFSTSSRASKRPRQKFRKESDSPSPSQKRRKRRKSKHDTKNRPTLRKSRSAWSDDSDSDEEVLPAVDQERDNSSGSEFDEIDSENISSPRRSNLKDVDRNSDCLDRILQSLSKLLEPSSKVVPQLSEIVYKRCRKCLDQICNLEAGLDSDGPGRALIASMFIDPEYLSIRTQLWEVLLHSEGSSMDDFVAKDIVHIGKKWEPLMKLSFSVVQSYTTELQSGIRDYYPPLEFYERLRSLFMQFSIKLLFVANPVFGANLSKKEKGNRNILSRQALAGFIDVEETFRLQGVFLMPRSSRIIYNHFATLLLYYIFHYADNQAVLSEEVQTIDSSLKKQSQLMRKEILHFLSDSDATVRMTSAGTFVLYFRASGLSSQAEIEQIMSDALPNAEFCKEGTSDLNQLSSNGELFERDESENHSERKNWKLSEQKVIEFNKVRASFKCTGSSAKGITALVALGETAAHNADLLPLCVFELLRRSVENSTFDNISFNVLIRLCIRINIVGPHELFVVGHRLILPKWFALFSDSKALTKFPSRLLFDVDRFRPGGVFDWMREHHSKILPFVLLSDVHLPALPNTRSYCEALGIPLKSMLENNVSCFCRMFPLMFVNGFDHDGRLLWNSIDNVLENQSSSLIHSKREEVQVALLLSISAGSSHYPNAAEDDKTRAVFLRDCRATRPPYYDALVIASTMNRLLGTDGNTTAVWRRSDLHGSLFGVESGFFGRDASENSASVSKGILKKTSTIISILLAVRKLFDGPPGPVHPQSRIDAMLIMGTIWHITGRSLLQESNKRRLLLKLVLRGFLFSETVSNALWLLRSITDETLQGTGREDCSLYDLLMDEALVSSLDVFTSQSERRVFELMFLTLPTLIEVSLGNGPSSQKKAAVSGILYLMQTARDKKMWAPLASIDLIPHLSCLKEAKKIQENASMHAAILRHTGSLEQEMIRFAVSERCCSDRGRQPSLTLSRLRRLRETFSESNRSLLAKLIHEQSWLRNEGRPEKMLNVLNEILGLLVDINHDITSFSSLATSSHRDNDYLLSQTSSSEVFTGETLSSTHEAILQECTWLIGVLGTMYPTAVVFESSRHRSEQRISPLQVTGKYEVKEDGVKKTLPLLREQLFCNSALIAQVAYNTLIAVLGTREGSSVFADHTEKLRSISEFRNIARKSQGARISSLKSSVFFDHRTGEPFEPSFLCLTNEKLWAVSNCEGTKERSDDVWVKRLAATLAYKSQNFAFSNLSAACFVSSDIARTLFPYLLMDFLSYADNSLINVISKLIYSQVLSDSTVPCGAVRIMIHGLDSICQLRLDDLRKKGMKGVYDDGVDYKDISYYYRFTIPYIAVGEAAVRVGMYFSAVRYATLHIDHEIVVDERKRIREVSSSGRRGNRRTSSLAPAVDASSVVKDKAHQAVEHILVWASENINEPDMRRGLGQHGDLLTTASQMAVFDTDWSRSIGTLDALCHRKENSEISNMLVAQRSSTVRETEDIPSVELMLINSLNGLGCTNLIAHYWNILKRKVVDAQIDSLGLNSMNHDIYLDRVGKLNEQRFATAWRLGDWEVPDVIVPEASFQVYSKPIIGVNQSIHKILSTLSTKDMKSVFNVIQSGRVSQAVWLGQMVVSASAHRVYEVADRVNVLNEIESSLFFMKPLAEEKYSEDYPELSEGSRNGYASRHHIFSLDLSAEQLSDTLSNLLRGDTEEVIHGRRGGHILVNKFFGSGEFGLDLRISVAKCLGNKFILARMAADVAGDIFAKGGTGAWARAAAVLGNPASVCLADSSDVDRVSWRIEESKLRWAASQDGRTKQNALSKVKELIENDLGGSFRVRQSKANKIEESFDFSWTDFDGEQDRIAKVRADACQLVASWSAEMRAEEPMTLFRSYLEMGLKAFDQAKDTATRGHAHYFMAEFADKQISNIDNYRKTKTYDQMVLAVERSEKTISKLEGMKGSQMSASGSSGRRRQTSGKPSGKSRLQRDLEIHLRNQKKKLTEDKFRLRRLDAKYVEWQLLACRHYASSIRDGSANDLRGSFRLVALWLDSGPMRSRITTDLVQANANYGLSVNVPLSKLLPLFPQLCSRLAVGSDSFQVTLSATLEAMSASFPSHCLWQLLALSNSTRVSGNEEKLSSFYRGDKDKKEAADLILARLQTSRSSGGSKTIRQMKLVADAYIELSETPNTLKKGKKSLSIGRSAICQLKNLSDVPVPTMGLPLYAHSDPSFLPPYISRFEGEARVCSGISMPLRVACLGSDGHTYAQLVKGKDDLRGDAVMEQMFTILNELLRRDADAARRNLLVRTYRIVPLSPFSGIMQFVTNTEPLANVLVLDTQVPGERSVRKSLHERYRPLDMKHAAMRDGAFQYFARSDMSKKINFLALNWHRLKPVFRFFFLEQWPDPADWFTHQLAYTRSVAVMSIVGFVLGIGDRHLSNILLDTASGEVVHIDFGIAFEQGKLLPTPELMPFRLTRDLVDGFGVSGVDGAFRHCSEVTLQVLRRNKDVLLTVFEVLLHDPMYNWALTPEEVLREQLQTQYQNETGTGNFIVDSGLESADGMLRKFGKGEEGSEEAQRALRRIAEKLDGMEDTERLSVEAHVARLIDEARAFQVLASVYPGWSPW